MVIFDFNRKMRELCNIIKELCKTCCDKDNHLYAVIIMSHPKSFYNEILKLQMQLFILEMWDIFMDQLERRNRTLQSGSLYERFVHLLELHCMKNREVQFYSDQLHITAKYLNQICKANTGITASQWIQRYAKDRIVLLLENKKLNISEISDEMGFSSHSFFTRYVKKVLGVSPSEYRNLVK